MTAPSAPVLAARHDGHMVYARWKSVADAASYKLYVGQTTAPTDLKATIDASTVGPDGRFQSVFLGDTVPIYLRLTALNAGAEESAPSNELLFLHPFSEVRHR